MIVGGDDFCSFDIYEMAIAKLVAQGLTNAEICKQLWIEENSVKQSLKRMFRKLNISSRTSLISLLLQ